MVGESQSGKLFVHWKMIKTFKSSDTINLFHRNLPFTLILNVLIVISGDVLLLSNDFYKIQKYATSLHPKRYYANVSHHVTYVAF